MPPAPLPPGPVSSPTPRSRLPRLVLALSLLCLTLGGVLLAGARGLLPPLFTDLGGPPDEAIYEYPRDTARNCDPAVFLALSDPATEQLVVRAGPGPQYRQRSVLSHGDTFLVFEYRGAWAGIAYGHNREVCGAQEKREMRATHRGWIPVQGISFLPGLPD